jgi:hypothetical protein
MARLAVLLLLPALLAPIGCNVLGYQAMWVQNQYPDTRAEDAMNVVVDTVDRDYDIETVDREAGRLDTRWSDSQITPFERRSTRAKVHVEILGGHGQPVVIRMRVEREVCKATSVFREHEGDDDWESYPDDREEADRLLTNVHMVLHEFGPSPALKERIQHAQQGSGTKGTP